MKSDKNIRETIKTMGLVLLLIGICMPLTSAQSVNVVIIGGTTLDTTCASYTASDANMMTATSGGCLPVNGITYPELSGFIFTAMSASGVSAASLAPFDTAVLNMATHELNCSDSNIPASAKSDILAFVAGGKKLIIFDSECVPGVDYSWMPFPFTTDNPGAWGATGILRILQNTTLGNTNPLSPYYINETDLSNNTDAVGDMNAVITYDQNWCLAMSGKNKNNVTGAANTYAVYPAGIDKGLIIYNGLDQDDNPHNANLRKIWVLELNQPFNPSNLPLVGSCTPVQKTQKHGVPISPVAVLVMLGILTAIGAARIKK